MTPKYLSEKVKLYSLAKQLCGEFARASHHCRENLVTLEQYWGLRMGDDQKKIAFHPTDRANMTAALYQTLYLFAPAFSLLTQETAETLEDIKKPGALYSLAFFPAFDLYDIGFLD